MKSPKNGRYNQHARVCKTCRRDPGNLFCKRGWDLLRKMVRSEEASRRAKGEPTWEDIAAVQTAIQEAKPITSV